MERDIKSSLSRPSIQSLVYSFTRSLTSTGVSSVLTLEGPGSSLVTVVDPGTSVALAGADSFSEGNKSASG